MKQIVNNEVNEDSPPEKNNKLRSKQKGEEYFTIIASAGFILKINETLRVDWIKSSLNLQLYCNNLNFINH